MFSDSTIDEQSIQAYLDTDYHVRGATPLTLKVGIPNTGLAALHKTHSVESSAYVTASNPFSQALDDSANDARQVVLAGELHQQGLTYIKGIGQHPTNGWTGEQSFLVLGLSREDARMLGARHEQNAIVWCGPNAVPELVLLR